MLLSHALPTCDARVSPRVLHTLPVKKTKKAIQYNCTSGTRRRRLGQELSRPAVNAISHRGTTVRVVNKKNKRKHHGLASSVSCDIHSKSAATSTTTTTRAAPAILVSKLGLAPPTALRAAAAAPLPLSSLGEAAVTSAAG